MGREFDIRDERPADLEIPFKITPSRKDLEFWVNDPTVSQAVIIDLIPYKVLAIIEPTKNI